jgi:hypothetical protein
MSWIGVAALFLKDEFTTSEYVVKVEYCNSQKIDTLKFSTKGGVESIQTYREAVPVLQIGKKRILNVCEYEIISKK